MLFPFVLASAALAVAAVSGRAPGPAAAAVYAEASEKEETTRTDHTAVQVTAEAGVGGDARASDLKYVLAIQKSSSWTDIKRRTLTIATDPRLAELLAARPETLSDGDLAAVRRACHDGLKCVAVDQLLVLRSHSRAAGDGTASVRTVITKITHVLTRYTTEYHEDTYQYQEVTPSDDAAAVHKTVTVMVEDNKKLCGLETADGSAVTGAETLRTTVTRDDRVEVHAGAGPDGGEPAANAHAAAGHRSSAARHQEHYEYRSSAAGDGAHDHEHLSSDKDKQLMVYVPSSHGAGPAATHVISPEASHIVGPADSHVAGPADSHGAGPTGHGPAGSAGHGLAGSAGHGLTGSAGHGLAGSAGHGLTGSADHGLTDSAGHGLAGSTGHGPAASSTNGGGTAGAGVSAKPDAGGAGDSNTGCMRKGHAGDDGIVTNGDAKSVGVNQGTTYNGVVNRSSTADGGGIVSIGTYNAGPVNYGEVNNFYNHETHVNVNSFDIQQFLTSVDKMYTTIMDGLEK